MRRLEGSPSNLLLLPRPNIYIIRCSSEVKGCQRLGHRGGSPWHCLGMANPCPTGQEEEDWGEEQKVVWSQHLWLGGGKSRRLLWPRGCTDKVSKSGNVVRKKIWKPYGTDIPTINIITTITRLNGLISFTMFTTFIRLVVSLDSIVSVGFNRFASFTQYWSAPTSQDVCVSKKNWTRGGIFRMLQHRHCFLPCID